VGLGLSIVQRIVEQHSARLHLSSWRAHKGFMAQVEFSAAP